MTVKNKIFVFLLIFLVSANAHSSRNRDALEKYDLSDLRLCCTTIQSLELAHIIDGEGYFHIAIRGSYIGKNFGVIKTIKPYGIEVCELLRDENTEEGKEEDWVDWVEKCQWLYVEIHNNQSEDEQPEAEYPEAPRHDSTQNPFCPN
jgi:hypothetical protein